MRKHERKHNRLKGYDYSQNGVYFITICIKDKKQILWNVGASCARPNDNSYQLSYYGEIVDKEIARIEKIYPKIVSIDSYVIMPNHIHLLIKIIGRAKLAPTISRIVQQFKGAVTKQIGFSIWQKLFYDHIIRNEKEYNLISEYMRLNPYIWKNDCYYK